MSVFSTNQNRHLYVVKGGYKAAVAETDSVGTIGGIKVFSDGLKKQLYFMYKGVDGLVKSDTIQLDNLNYVKAIKASDMVIPMKKYKVTLLNTVNSGNPIVGQDYIIRIVFKNWCGAGDDVTYFKDIAVRPTTSSASDFYKALVKAANLSFSREVNATSTSNPYLAFSVDNASTATGFYVEEKPQSWTLGIETQERVNFELQPTTVYNGTADVEWGKVDEVASTTTVGNGKQVADLEWFCMGERGDQYRLMCWPNYVPTQYLVDPTKEYNILEIHHAFTDEGVSSYRSEKDITLAFPVGATGEEYDEINAFIGAFNTATGLSIATLSDPEEDDSSALPTGQ